MLVTIPVKSSAPPVSPVDDRGDGVPPEETNFNNFDFSSIFN